MQGGPQDPVEGPPGETAFVAVTSRRRRGPALVAVAAIVFLGAAVLIKQFASASPAPDATGTPAASGVAAVASTAPTAEPTASATPDPPALDPTVTPHPTFPAVPVPPGIDEVTWTKPPTASVAISLPAGWQQADAGLYVKPDAAEPVGLSIGATRSSTSTCSRAAGPPASSRTPTTRTRPQDWPRPCPPSGARTRTRRRSFRTRPSRRSPPSRPPRPSAVTRPGISRS